ncbi:MAG: hypothetical protein KAR38_02785, partial [Calditrichia bacterium]|nr:hypothetical protein [Calditrichia bacterium]
DVLTLIGGYKNKLHLKSWYKNLKEKWWYKATAWILPLADEVEFSFRFRYLGGRPYSPPQYLERYHRWRVLGGQKYNTERYPVYNRFDIRLDRRYFFKHFNMVTYFDIMNVYHRKNIWEYSYNDDGSIEKVEQFSVFPVGGIVLEF